MVLRKWIANSLVVIAGVALAAVPVCAQSQRPTNATPNAAPRNAQPTPPVAIVNGEPITIGELESVIKLIPPGQTAPTAAQTKQMRQEALDMLIDDVLIRQFLSKNAPPVTPAEFNKELDMLLKSLKVRNTTLEAFLQDTHQTEAHLRQDIVKKLQWERYLQTKVTDADLKKYYDTYRAFYDQVTVRVSHILLRLPPNASQGDRESARARLAQIRQKIFAKQTTFEDAAKQFSQCPSASRGGDIGTIMRKWVVDERIARAAFELKVGDVSDIVETDYGMELLTVTARNPGQPSNFDKIKELVRENLGMEYWHEILVQQRKIAKIENKLN